ncbi:MAG: hypothetical protein IAF08_09680, partial [Rhizobacter sp.]|nr:hypothetical protein [Chlorobiales bacterium]
MNDARALELLLRKRNHTLSESEQRELEATLQNSPDLREAEKMLMTYRHHAEQHPAAFKPFFKERTVARLQRREGATNNFATAADATTDAALWLLGFRPVFAFGVVAILMLLGYNAHQGGAITMESLFGLETGFGMAFDSVNVFAG